MRSIAIIGCGPLALYLLDQLSKSLSPSRITIFERTGAVGMGTPYRRDANDPALLANIASIEIPPLYESFEDWLTARTTEGLSSLGVSRDEIHERAFLPRVVLGSYFRDQFVQLSEKTRARGHSLVIRLNQEVTDIAFVKSGIAVVAHGESTSQIFDDVILATGHGNDIAKTADAEATYHSSPYPTSRLAMAPPARIGILGTSLSAIDAVLTVANRHGTFEKKDSADVFKASEFAASLHFTMMSRTGILPGTDFFVPIPYEPLDLFTREAVDEEISKGSDGLLARLIALFHAQLKSCDADYNASNKGGNRDAHGLYHFYFAERRSADPIAWAKQDLLQTTALNQQDTSVSWKSAILRMHEPFEAAVKHFTPDDRATFDATLRKIFVDNYAAVPAGSIGKLLALNNAGMFSVVALGDDYSVQIGGPALPHLIIRGNMPMEFDYLIDATGQAQHDLSELPFRTLASVAHEHLERDHTELTGVPVITNGPHRVFVASLPYLLADRPFVQGIVACHEISKRVAASLLMSDER